MSGEGMTRMQTYVASHPPQSPAQRRKIVSAFLDKFALPDRVDQDIIMPGWTAETVEELTELYDEDVARIAAMPNVRLIRP